MLDWRGRVAETHRGQHLLRDGRRTAHADPDCFLDGITRRSVMSLARRQQMKVVERPIESAEIARATEVFLAGTAAEVTPVREIAGHRYTPARITETLLRELRCAGAAVAGRGGEGGGGVDGGLNGAAGAEEISVRAALVQLLAIDCSRSSRARDRTLFSISPTVTGLTG